ncbi:MAG: signal recognition particle protein [Muribaculaceae bacterium]|nr:signal recognition particle protein [Muribaculaceae bacterium]
MFENLSERLERSFKILKGEGKITEINVAETMRDVRRALLDADVNYKVAKQFTDTVKAKALGQNVLTSVKPKEQMVKIVHDELAELMGGDAAKFNISGSPAIVLMSGLQGSGKTTFSGKLARKFKSEQGKRPLLVACDVYRPAAIDQLKVVGEQIEVPVYTEPGEMDPVKIALNGVAHAKANHYDLVVVDTAGRLAVDEKMMQEMEALKAALNPQEILFVVDAMTGQDAVNTAKAFNDRLDFNGVVLTKLDGDTRGGAALSIRTVVNKPIKFVGRGEKMDAIDVFHPSRMADRILGMGDIVTLVEKAQAEFDEKQARELERKIARNKFDFNDFMDQIKRIEKMGSLKDIASMIPGLGKAIKDVEIKDDAFKSIKAIISSMTEEERSNPDIIKGSRRQRIARGSGTDLTEVNKLLKQFDEMRKMMRAASGMKNPAQMMKAARQMQQMRAMGGMRRR